VITFEPFNPLDYIKTPEQLEAYVIAAIEEEREAIATMIENEVRDYDRDYREVGYELAALVRERSDA
jgi:predicted ester cyclase